MLSGLVLALAGCGALQPGGGLPRGYDLLFSPAPHAFRFATLPEPVRRGARSERFELRDGDCGGSDCTNPRYRSEIIEKEPRARVGHDIWYGWSFRNVSIPAFAERDALRLVLGQWKLDGETPPAFRLVQIGQGAGNWQRCDPTICRPVPPNSEDVVIQLVDIAERQAWGPRQNGGHICKLFSMEDARTRWMDIVVNTDFGAGPGGYLRAWVNGELRCDYRGQIVASGPGDLSVPLGVRRGIFSSFTSRWDESRGTTAKPTLIAHYDEFAIGATREDVDVRLREAAGLRPID